MFIIFALIIAFSGATCLCSQAKTGNLLPTATPPATAVPTFPAPKVTSKPTLPPTPAPTSTPAATPTPTPIPLESLRKVTLKDEEVTPLLPVKSAWLHFLPDNEVRVGYKGLGFKMKIGINGGRLYADGVPPWLDVSLIDKDAPKYSIREGSRIIVTGFPAWFDLSKYDKDLTVMPELVALETQEGQATVYYKPEKK